MDLGIAGKSALVCAASKGLGKGCAINLAREGVNLTIVARTKETIEATAAEIRAATGVKVTAIAADITTPEGRKAALAACPEPDILVNNAGGPPPGDFREWNRDVWIKALDANMLTPIELIKATVDGMMARGFGRTINNLLPGPFDTDRLRGTMVHSAKASGRSVDEVAAERARQNPAGRFGTAEEFGAACAFLCSVQAGYITGQNLLMDGGAYPGTF